MNSYSTQIICVMCGEKALAGSSKSLYCFECRDKRNNQRVNEARKLKRQKIKHFEDTGKHWGTTK